MADVDEIIDYIKTLKKGFDKDLFQSKIEELSHAVETVGLDYNDFHTLFKVWLNLSIPITKWMSLGACIMPPDKVEEKTVDYALRWILANFENQTSFSRIGFLLDWFTAAMDCDCIDMTALDSGYEIFYVMLTFEVLTTHAMKLVYTLTKPVDVNRGRVLELLDYAKKREAKKNLYRQLQVLLGLFKSYRPDCVPEDVPAISIHAAFKKINSTLLSRFKKLQESRHSRNMNNQHLLWINPLNSEKSRNRKAEPLIPNMEFLDIGRRQQGDVEPRKNHLDFSDPVSLLQYSLHHSMSRPARLRALLCNEAGLVLLTCSGRRSIGFLSHELRHLLASCFLDGSPHSYGEKQDFLQRLVILQRTLMQGLPIITRFLAQYLPLWNEKDYFSEILDLAEWIHVDNASQVECIVRPFTRMYHSAAPLRQLAILNCLTKMYGNLVYCSTRSHDHLMGLRPSDGNYEEVLPLIADSISRMSGAALQVDPDDTRLLYSSLSSAERMTAAETRAFVAPQSLPRPLVLSLALLGVSSIALDKAGGLMLRYQKMFSSLKASNKLVKNEMYKQQILTLRNYTTDLMCCLYNEEALRNRKNGIVFESLHSQLIGKLYSIMPDIDSKLSIRNHLAFAPYTYMQLEGNNLADADNKIWFNTVIDQEFPYIGEFLAKTIPDLRS